MSNLKIHNASQWCYKHGMKLPSKALARLLRIMYSCDLQPTAQIDSSVVFAHKGLGCVVGFDTVIGEGTKIMQNVTIGGRNGIRANPVIGKNCLIGTGACIMGDVKIGDNVKIGANAVVISDIPDNCTAVGIPAKVIKK